MLIQTALGVGGLFLPVYDYAGRVVAVGSWEVRIDITICNAIAVAVGHLGMIWGNGGKALRGEGYGIYVVTTNFSQTPTLSLSID